MKRIQKSEEHSTWGKTVSIRFYLNKKLKPSVSGDGKRKYSLYARVVCKKQVCDFKVDVGQMITEKEFALSQQNPQPKKRDQKSKALLLDFVISYTTSDINLIMSLVHPFERENFVLKNLPELLRLYSEIELELHNKQGFAEIKNSLSQSGYNELIEIIDWKQKKYPDEIAFALEELQRKGKIKTFKVWNNYEPKLSFALALTLLCETILEKGKYPTTRRRQNELINLLIERKLIHPKGAQLAAETLERAVEFATQAMKLTTR